MLLEQMIPSLRVLAWPGPSRIFEIGACEGEDTIKYARAFPGARMFLFEPLPANADRIAHVLAQDSSIKASLFRVALSDQAGTAIFHVSSAAKNVTSDPSAEKWAGNKSSSLLEPRDDKPAALSGIYPPPPPPNLFPFKFLLLLYTVYEFAILLLLPPLF